LKEPWPGIDREKNVKENLSRRSFLGTSAGFAAAGLSAVANPIAAAAQSVGVKPGDLPDLTIKEVKVYVTDISKHPQAEQPGERRTAVHRDQQRH
jgi:hypothetical protein